MELRPGSVVNLGIGIPEGVANVAAEEHILDYLTLTAEPGAMGGIPAGGWISVRRRTRSHLGSAVQFDFYDGAVWTPRSWAWLRRTAWATSTSAGSGRSWRARGVHQHQPECQAAGVHRDLRRAEPLPGAGRPAGHRRRCRGAEVSRRCRAADLQRQYAAAAGQPVLYVTERCVFQLTPAGLELTEIAPGVDLEKDVLAHIGSSPSSAASRS